MFGKFTLFKQKVWQMNTSAKGLLIVNTNLDGFRLPNHRQFAKFAKLSRYTVTTIYVTGYWKTDHNVTLGQLHFIGPANSHTHALSMHCCINGLS